MRGAGSHTSLPHARPRFTSRPRLLAFTWPPFLPFTAARLNMSRPIPYPVISTPTAILLVPNKFTAPTLRKCKHSVYWPAGEPTNPYCQICTPGGPRDQRAVVLPRSSADPLTTAGRMMANKHATGCSNCGSAIYSRVTESNASKRICADCGHVYTVRLTQHQRALLAEAEAADE